MSSATAHTPHGATATSRCLADVIAFAVLEIKGSAPLTWDKASAPTQIALMEMPVQLESASPTTLPTRLGLPKATALLVVAAPMAPLAPCIAAAVRLMPLKAAALNAPPVLCDALAVPPAGDAFSLTSVMLEPLAQLAPHTSSAAAVV